MRLPSKEDAHLCASVVKEIARAKGITGDPASVGALTVAVARLFNSGLRDRDVLLSEAMTIADIPVSHGERSSLSGELRTMNSGAVDLPMEPENERGHQ
jgi:hypothetical protein